MSESYKAGWLRFSPVTKYVPDGQTLYRSSAPNYKQLKSGDNDASQRLTDESVAFLSKIGIDSIISFNQYPYTDAELTKLTNANITYFHCRVRDFAAPTVNQLREAGDWFIGKKSTLVHCGYGHGRTGTGVTALQIRAVCGHTLEPYANKWPKDNHVEERRQISAIAELRNVLSLSKVRGIPDVVSNKTFKILNFATGYYLSVSDDCKSVTAKSPESLESGEVPPRQYCWDIVSDENTNNFTLSDRKTPDSFAITKATEAKTGDFVNNGSVTVGDVNNLFTITEVQDVGSGIYIISPAPNPDLALSISEPGLSFREELSTSALVDVRISTKDEKNKFGLWVLFPIWKSLSSRS